MSVSRSSAGARVVLATALASIVAPAIASAQDCYRPAECDGEDVCIGNVCAPSDEPLATCGESVLCEEAHAVCDDGYCKLDAVYCENPAGYGYEENLWGRYVCGTGEASDWMADEPPDVTLTDPELFDRCQESLVALCGEEAPDISDECTDDQLTTCTEMYEHVNELLEACGEEPEEIGYAALAGCCGDLADDPEEFDVVYGCIMGLEPADCAQLEECYGDSENTGDDGPGDESESASEASEGCGYAPVGSASTSFLSMLTSSLV